MKLKAYEFKRLEILHKKYILGKYRSREKKEYLALYVKASIEQVEKLNKG